MEETKPKTGGSTHAEYAGLPGRTRQEAIHYTCGSCGALFGAAVYTAVNVASDPELGDSLSKGELNALTCSSCGAVCTPSLPLLYHDPSARTFALLLPENARHLELRERARVLTSLMDDPSDIPDYVRPVQAVFGTSGLLNLLDKTIDALTPRAREVEDSRVQEELAALRAELERREEELMGHEEDLQAKQEDLIAERAKLEATREDLVNGWKELDREREALRALSLELQAREDKLAHEEREAARAEEEVREPKPVVEGRPEGEVERWLASDEPAASLAYEGMTFLLARPPADMLDLFTGGEPELLIQLFELPEAPLIALVALPVPRADDKPAAEQSITWYLDPSSAKDRQILDQLAEEFYLSMDIFTPGSRRAATWEIQAPLTENVRCLLDRCGALLEQQDSTQRDFSKARLAHQMMGEERLGRKQHNFTADSFREMPSPAAARLALGIVSYWSEQENQDYLIHVKSFPMTYWRAIRERVVRKGLEFGLHLSAALTAFALEQKLAPSRPDLLRSAVSNFAEVSLRIKPSDLDPNHELENWRLLLADCLAEGIRVDLEIEELAAAAAKRAGVEVDERAPGGDLGLLSDDEILPLLADRAQSRDVALELCERGDPKFIEPVYRAVCNMTRAEVARVVPAMLQLGPGTIPYFVRGLKHRKSFVRQGCALALGALKAESGIQPLMEMLLGEPTNVWKEASRALGDMGQLSLGALVAGLKAADAQGRERLAWALSQATLTKVCLVEVEAMAKGRDTRLARVAGRALQLMHQVRAFDREVRGATPLRERTIVRSFTRQFFEAMAGEASELEEDDILEQEEVLDDNDIIDETVEVGEEDIVENRV